MNNRLSLMRSLRKTPSIEYLRAIRWHWHASRQRKVKRKQYPRCNRDQLPTIFGNAITKGGSHLLAQYLEGVSQLSQLVFTSHQPIRKIAPEGRERPDSRVLKDLSRLQPGDIGWGYIPARSPFLAVLTDMAWITYFICRDPRDKIISHIYFAMDIHDGHVMRSLYHSMPTMEARIAATIRGVPGMLPGIGDAYESYRAWLGEPAVINVRFEDLIDNRNETLLNMIKPLQNVGVMEDESDDWILNVLNQSMSPTYSLTFRSGRSGSWQEYFSKTNKVFFKEVTGNLLVELGYEKDDNW